MEKEKIKLVGSPKKKKVRTAVFLAYDIVGASKREYSKYLSVTPIRPRVWKSNAKNGNEGFES